MNAGDCVCFLSVAKEKKPSRYSWFHSSIFGELETLSTISGGSSDDGVISSSPLKLPLIA